MPEQENTDWAGEISAETRLSFREAELYVLHVELEKSLNTCAQEMDVISGTVSRSWGRIKEKIREAQKDRTEDLQIPQ